MVRLAGVHPSSMVEDAWLSFVTNSGIWRTYRKTRGSRFPRPQTPQEMV